MRNSRGSHKQDDQLYVYQRLSAKIKKSFQESLEEQGEADAKCTPRRVVVFVLTKPFNFARDITIPISEEDSWNRTMASLSPVVGLIFFLISTERNIILV